MWKLAQNPPKKGTFYLDFISHFRWHGNVISRSLDILEASRGVFVYSCGWIALLPNCTARMRNIWTDFGGELYFLVDIYFLETLQRPGVLRAYPHRFNDSDGVLLIMQCAFLFFILFQFLLLASRSQGVGYINKRSGTSKLRICCIAVWPLSPVEILFRSPFDYIACIAYK